MQTRQGSVWSRVGIWLAAVCWLASLPGCGRNPGAAAIERVLREDAAYQQQVFENVSLIEEYWDGTSVLQRYVVAIRGIDLTGCPQDFQRAYLDYVHACMALHSHAQSKSGFSGFLRGFFDGTGTGRAVETNDGVWQRVQESWFVVEQVALQHGVLVTAIESPGLITSDSSN